MPTTNILLFVNALIVTLFLTACGGGGGGGGAPQDNFTVSANQLDFSADIDATNVATQIVTGTVNNVNSPVRVDVVIDGTAIANADFAFAGTNSGQLTVSVQNPATLGVGTHTDQIRVYVCTNFATCVNDPSQISGSPQIINVSFEVTATPTVRAVAPRFVQPNSSGEVIIRGVGFSLLSAPTVSFGGNAALSINIINDTEIRATVPALAAGDYSVDVSDLSAAIATTATLHVLAEPDLGYAFIANSGAKSRVIYDALRDVFYVGNKDAGQLLRYAHSVDPVSGNPLWTPSNLSFANISDIAMLPDGDTLLVANSTALVHVDLDTFSVTASTNFTSFFPLSSGTFIRQIAVANNGIAFAATGFNGGFAGSQVYKYNTRNRSVEAVSGLSLGQDGVVNVSGDGSRIVIGAVERVSFSDIYAYNATDDSGPNGLGISETASALSIDRTGTTIITGTQNQLNDQREVYKSGIFLGSIPGANTNFINSASGLSADGNTLYGYNPEAGNIQIFDLTSSDGSGSFNQSAASPVAVADSIGNTLALTMGFTPFDTTVFIAGELGIVIQPLP